MREIKFRAWGIKKNCWLPDWLYRQLSGSPLVHVTEYETDSGEWVNYVEDQAAEDEYVLEQFTGLRDKNEREIYEGDIVKVLTNRIPQYEQEWNPRSKHDAKKIESRSVIVFERFGWRLNTDTEYNRKILELKGGETEQRRLSIREHLEDYHFFQESNPSSAWNREHNSHAYWSDIEVIGNIHENPELLNG